MFIGETWRATNDIEKGDAVVIDLDRGTATSVGKPTGPLPPGTGAVGPVVVGLLARWLGPPKTELGPDGDEECRGRK